MNICHLISDVPSRKKIRLESWKKLNETCLVVDVARPEVWKGKLPGHCSEIRKRNRDDELLFWLFLLFLFIMANQQCEVDLMKKTFR